MSLQSDSPMKILRSGLRKLDSTRCIEILILTRNQAFLQSLLLFIIAQLYTCYDSRSLFFLSFFLSFFQVELTHARHEQGPFLYQLHYPFGLSFCDCSHTLEFPLLFFRPFSLTLGPHDHTNAIWDHIYFI
jgi:hypothetical protein